MRLCGLSLGCAVWPAPQRYQCPLELRLLPVPPTPSFDDATHYRRARDKDFRIWWEAMRIQTAG
jgi:hypothetical protein